MPKTKVTKKTKTKKSPSASSSAKTVKGRSKTSTVKKDKYIESIGRRKTATARVRIYPSAKKKDFVVNEKSLDEYFPSKRFIDTVKQPFEVVDNEFDVTVQVKGGGINAQSEAIRMGLSRALVENDEAWKSKLKAAGYLTRDSRMVERKKPGLRKARRPQQWKKR
ncbi:MAG: 30S ribosomal protein S9 [Candidatus Paceibacterota bacterium]